jgi:FtsH-binding integral membrane protein
MSNLEDKTVWRAHRGLEAVQTGEGVDQGLRAYLSQVYMFMALGLLLTGGMSYTVANVPALMNLIFGTPLQWVVIFAPLALVFFLSFRINTLKLSTAQGLFWLYSALVGLSLASIFFAYTGESIARVFFITSSMFGAMSFYGYTTAKDLSGLGSFMFMGLVGIIIAGLINMFLQSSAMQFVISLIAVIVFTGLTAYDTQRIKLMYYEGDTADVTGKKALMGALTLYLDFLNLFIAMLRLLGDRR